MKPFTLLGRLAKKYSKMIFLTTLTMLGLVGAQLLIPWIIRQLIDRLTTQPLNAGTIDFITRISAIALIVFWRYVGFNLVLYLAALQTIPPDIYEAATMDGASSATGTTTSAGAAPPW